MFSRYTSIAPEQVTGTASGYKIGDLSEIPKYIDAEPFGFGLGTAGSVAGFGGKVHELFEGHNINAETQPNLLVKELGVFGHAALVRVPAPPDRAGGDASANGRDDELQLLLVALAAPLVAVFFMSIDGPVSTGVSGGLYLYFAAGVMRVLVPRRRARPRRSSGVGAR